MVLKKRWGWSWAERGARHETFEAFRSAIHRRWLERTLGLFGFVIGSLPASAAAQTGYFLPDGSVQIVCREDLAGITQRLDELLARQHPGVRFTVHPANDLAALQTLAFDASLCAAVGADALGGAAVAYGALVHGEPFSIRIAHASLDPSARIAPLAVIAHPSNPLDQISVDQVARVFTEPMRKPNFTHWGQLGVTGPLASGAIHPCGLAWSEHFPSEDTGFADWMFQRKLGGGPPVASYEMAATYAEVGAKVAADPFALGLIALNRVPAGVKVIAVKGAAWDEPAKGSRDEIVAGQYAFDRYVYLYFRRVPGQPFDALAREYARLALSAEGQRAIGADSRHYLPLNAVELGEELAKVQR